MPSQPFFSREGEELIKNPNWDKIEFKYQEELKRDEQYQDYSMGKEMGKIRELIRRREYERERKAEQEKMRI